MWMKLWKPKNRRFVDYDKSGIMGKKGKITVDI